MFLDNLQSSPQTSSSLAMSMVSIGLFLVVLGTGFAHIGLQQQFPAWEDFARGLFYGMGMALELIGVVLMSKTVRRPRGRA